jgi:hypothetical protein
MLRTRAGRRNVISTIAIAARTARDLSIRSSGKLAQ